MGSNKSEAYLEVTKCSNEFEEGKNIFFFLNISLKNLKLRKM